MSLTIDGRCVGSVCRLLVQPYSVWDSLTIDDITTHDLELHSFLRFSHQFVVNPDSMAGEKIEEMFELENPNI